MTFIILAVLIFITIWAGILADAATVRYNNKVEENAKIQREYRAEVIKMANSFSNDIPVGGVYKRRG